VKLKTTRRRWQGMDIPTEHFGDKFRFVLKQKGVKQ